MPIGHRGRVQFSPVSQTATAGADSSLVASLAVHGQVAPTERLTPGPETVLLAHISAVFPHTVTTTTSKTVTVYAVCS